MARTPRTVLTPKQKKVALLLARGATIADASKEVHVPVRTIMDWKNTALFINEIGRLTNRLMKEFFPAVQQMVFAKAIQGTPWACQLVYKHQEAIHAAESRVPDTKIEVSWVKEPILPVSVTEEDSPLKEKPVIHLSSEAAGSPPSLEN